MEGPKQQNSDVPQIRTLEHWTISISGWAVLIRHLSSNEHLFIQPSYVRYKMTDIIMSGIYNV